MARLIKCPRCQSQLDATNVSGGATIRCSDCGAMVRVPTGSTGVRPAVPAAAPAPAARAGGGRSTDLFKKMAGTRAPGGSRVPSRSSVEAEGRRAPASRGGKSNTAMIGLCIAGGLGLAVIVLIFATQAKTQRIAADKEAKLKHKESVEKHNAKVLEDFRREEAEIDAQEKANKAAEKAGKKPALQKDGKGGYTAPATFEAGASRQVKGAAAGVPCDAGLQKEFDALASSGKVADIVKEPGKWFNAMLNGLLSDNEPVARGSFQAIHDMCVAKNITTDSGKNPVRLDLFNSSQWRGGEFQHWSDWWEKAQNKIAMGVNDPKLQQEIRTKGGSGDASKANWTKLMQDLRSGGAFDQPDRPEGKAFEQVKSMGPSAYPELVKFVDNEDIVLAKAAVKVLNTLTGREGQMPNDANKGQIKAEWQAWVEKQGK